MTFILKIEPAFSPVNHFASAAELEDYLNSLQRKSITLPEDMVNGSWMRTTGSPSAAVAMIGVTRMARKLKALG